MCLLHSLILFEFKVLANCLQMSLAHFVMTCECHFHLAVSEDGCAFFHLYIFGLKLISKDKWWINFMLYYVPMFCRAVLYTNFEVIFLDISHSFQIVLHCGTLLYWIALY